MIWAKDVNNLIGGWVIMARIGTGRPADKEVERELKQAVQENLPGEEVLRRLTADFVIKWMELLKEGSLKFQDRFLADFMSGANSGSQGYSSSLLPEGTRFIRNAHRSAMFVIEQKPSVRTLSFKRSGINHSDKTRHRLALPYIIFIPVFTYYDPTAPSSNEEKPYFGVMCVAYRNAPLTSMSDMLYHPNLPNLSHTQDHNPSWNADGNVATWTEMIACQGYQNSSLYTAFSVQPSDVVTMTDEVLGHFWSSEFTDELSTHYHAMSKREPDHFRSLKTWEKSSQEDPMFPLKTQWCPAIRLNTLMDMIAAHYDANRRSTAATSNYVMRVVNHAWDRVGAESEEMRATLARQITIQLQETFNKFAVSAARGLLVINNETVRRTVQFAIATAMKDAMK